MTALLTFLVGLPGSGKTTVAREMVQAVPPGTAIAISRDDLREAYFGTKEGLTSDQEHQITALQHSQIEKALTRGLKVVVHDCNLRMQYRKQLAAIAERLGVEWMQVDLTHVPLETCLSRNALREHPVPEEVIREMHTRYIKALAGKNMPVPVIKPEIVAPARELYVPDWDKPRVVMVDVDGTVALHEGVRDPYDTSRYHLDKPNQAVIDLVQGIQYGQNTGIVFCSGRHQDFRGVTEEWLYENVRVEFSLYMRENHGTRDDIEKLDLFDKYIRKNYNVNFVLDDRDRVVKAWRSIGLTCLQVAPGDF